MAAPTGPHIGLLIKLAEENQAEFVKDPSLFVHKLHNLVEIGALSKAQEKEILNIFYAQGDVTVIKSTKKPKNDEERRFLENVDQLKNIAKVLHDKIPQKAREEAQEEEWEQVETDFAVEVFESLGELEDFLQGVKRTIDTEFLVTKANISGDRIMRGVRAERIGLIPAGDYLDPQKSEELPLQFEKDYIDAQRCSYYHVYFPAEVPERLTPGKTVGETCIVPKTREDADRVIKEAEKLAGPITMQSAYEKNKMRNHILAFVTQHPSNMIIGGLIIQLKETLASEILTKLPNLDTGELNFMLQDVELHIAPMRGEDGRILRNQFRVSYKAKGSAEMKLKGRSGLTKAQNLRLDEVLRDNALAKFEVESNFTFSVDDAGNLDVPASEIQTKFRLL